MEAASSLGAPMEPMSVEEAAGKLWWIFIVTGSLWILFSLIMFQFDYTSVTAVSILFGAVCIAGALEELISIPASHGWWRAGRIALALLFLVIGVVAFVHPGNTFNALAAVFAFFLLLRGIFTIVAALTHLMEPMWLGLLAGSIEIGLAFWAAGDFGHKTILLLVWVGLSALIHGVMQIVLAIHLRSLQSA
jgi:uncharacterized membrane protein HdeD (DUF308 family)